MLPAFLPLPSSVPFKAIGVGLVAGGLALVVFLAYRHYTNLVTENRVLAANNAVLETTIGTQSDTIDAQARALDDWAEAQRELLRAARELQTAASAARAETRRLNDIFSRHDLESLALARPGLIENRINAGTGDAMRMLECSTGAERPDCPDGDTEAGRAPSAARPGADRDPGRDVEGPDS